MDRRSWPWRKKSSEKTVSAPDPVAGSSNGSTGNQEDQDNSKNVVSYVQLSQERYAHLSEMEDQAKILNEKLSAAQSEVATKDNLVKQHTKVAEEAVSGWEKAEAEALALKTQLESVTLLKLTAEERSAHLDGALKECMKQIRTVKEESEQKLHDVVFAKTKQWEKVKFDLEAKVNAFEQELLRSSAENAALSRSLQERSNMLMKVSEEKSKADAEIEVLKANIQSCEREINSLKYEVHIVSKELEIRNEEKNMSVRSAEVANKQHLEDVKKITKLEAECQRLRGLVRKKLPGPAALAQMKLEVESLGRDYGETRLRRSPAKNTSPHLSPAPDYALENMQQYQKENEFLTARLLATEEETKMLKEALSKRNGELQAQRNIFAKTATKLRTMEAHMLVLNQQKSPSKSNLDIPIEGSLSQNESNPPSMTSMSEDGIDEEASCAESWATALISELSQFKKEKDINKSSKADSSSHLELMDDFLEMERLACLSTESNGAISILDGVTDKTRIDTGDGTSAVDGPKDVKSQKDQQSDLQMPTNLASSNGEQTAKGLVSSQNEVPLSKLQSRIASIFDSQGKDANMGRLLEDIKHVVHDIEEELPQHSVSCNIDEVQSINASSDQKQCNGDIAETTDCDISLTQDINNSCTQTKSVIAENLKKAISQIHDFVLSFIRSSDAHGIDQMVWKFSSVVSKVLSCELNVDEFIMNLSTVLFEANELGCRMLGDKDNEGESNSSACIDKVTLLENKVVQHEPGKDRFADPPPDSDILQVRSGPEFGGNTLGICSVEEFEQLKAEKDKLVVDLSRCTQSLEQTKTKLLETEKQLSDLQSQLANCQKSNSLAETQLKCMAESYWSLESRSHELETEINLLRTKAEALDKELQEERSAHQECLSQCKDLQEQMERNGKCSMCSLPSEGDIEVKTKQEQEIAAAAEKLAECQETIFLLGRQLKALHPQSEAMSPSQNERHRMSDDFSEDVLSTSGSNPQGWPNSQHSDHAEMENIASTLQRTGGESPYDGYNFYSPSDTEASTVPKSPISSKLPKHKSSRSSSMSNPTEEKHGRGFSRFFSKGRSNQ